MSKEHTFLKDGKIFYDMISEERIREIIREEIVEYNEIFMSKSNPNFEEEVTATKMPIQAPFKLCSGEEEENIPFNNDTQYNPKKEV